MRFTKFLAAIMAAMTIVSCSEQVEDFGDNVQSGDAVLSFKVGTNGGTTYATAAEESEIKTLIVYLAYKDAINSDALMEIPSTKDGMKITLQDNEFTPGSAKLYFIANMPSAAGKTTEADLLKLIDDKSIYTNSAGTLTLNNSGMTATHMENIFLRSGLLSDEILLKRLAARVYAVSGNGKNIQDFKVNFRDVKAGANLFTYVGEGTGMDLMEYKITGVSTGQYRGEAVGYLYPSGDVTISINNLYGTTKTLTFRPESNKNYKLLISPAVDASLDYTVKIVDYQEGEELPVEFN